MRSWRRWWALGVAAVGLLAASACSAGANRRIHEQCGVDSDCVEGLICLQYHCESMKEHAGNLVFSSELPAELAADAGQ